MRVLCQIFRGCTDLPHVGSHPGTGMLFVFILMGAAAGSKGGLWGCAGGALLMAVCVVPLYLWGAYSRAQDSDRFVYEAMTPEQQADHAIKEIIAGWSK